MFVGLLLEAKGAKPSPPEPGSLLQIEMIQTEVPTAQGKEVLPSAYPGRWKEEAEPGPGYLMVLWGSETFHSHHGKRVPMQRDTCPGSESLGVEGRQQHIPNQGR